jgi:hypothetical protein
MSLYLTYIAILRAGHLRTDYSLGSSTTDQYFPHFLSSLKQARLLKDSSTIRSERLSMMMTAFSNTDASWSPPLGRCVNNSSGISPLNPESTKPLLEARYGKILQPLFVDYGTVAATVHKRFPDDEIVCYKSDFNTWYKRVRLSITSTLLSTTGYRPTAL